MTVGAGITKPSGCGGIDGAGARSTEATSDGAGVIKSSGCGGIDGAGAGARFTEAT